MEPPASSPRISVVVPVLNAGSWLARSIDGLLRQTISPDAYEVLFVDNGSTDGSRETARAEPRVRALDEPHPGSYAARNRGVQAARGSILAFTDADCAAEPRWIETILQAFENPATALVCGARRPGSTSLPLALVGDYERTKDQWVLESGRAEIYYGYTCNMALRREVFDSLGPFAPVSRGGDTIFVQKVIASRSCVAVRFLPGMAVTHLEMDRLGVYFRKLMAYSFHRSLNNRTGFAARPLGPADRLAVFRETVRGYDYTAPRAALLLSILLVGAGFWHLGSFVARFSHPKPLPSPQP